MGNDAAGTKRGRRMTWLWITLGVVAVVGGLPPAVGAFVSRTHSATVARAYPRPPQEVWDTITDFEAMPDWRQGVKRVEILEPVDGKRRIREHTGFGPMTYAIEAEESPRRLVLGIADEGQGFGGTWTYEIQPAGEGAELRITEDGFIDNLYFRSLARFVFGYERTMRGYHDSLRGRLASD